MWCSLQESFFPRLGEIWLWPSSKTFLMDWRILWVSGICKLVNGFIASSPLKKTDKREGKMCSLWCCCKCWLFGVRNTSRSWAGGQERFLGWGWAQEVPQVSLLFPQQLRAEEPKTHNVKISSLYHQSRYSKKHPNLQPKYKSG